ncbi:unnamed protein product [Protopolystoma xenopodis]|uniref:Uncharacterized protein n=1 Tax=Protopolystoma xenopodis TaxID=117903 RepID=A0A448XQ05_9PLAT|nr:unnamed protein product [Protopolystoma xenopodis]
MHAFVPCTSSPSTAGSAASLMCQRLYDIEDTRHGDCVCAYPHVNTMQHNMPYCAFCWACAPLSGTLLYVLSPGFGVLRNSLKRNALSWLLVVRAGE